MSASTVLPSGQRVTLGNNLQLSKVLLKLLAFLNLSRFTTLVSLKH